MPNWCTNRLTILVPRKNAAALKAELEGPGVWPSPDGGGHGLERQKPSAHKMIEMESNAQELIAQFRALPQTRYHPDWMPVSELDILVMQEFPEKLDPGTVPFSIPALTPWKGREEFDEYCPGQQNGPFWDVKEEERRNYNTGNIGMLRLCRDRTGVKWPPCEVELIDEDTDSKSDLVDIQFRYDTPWGPVETLADIMHDVLKRHGAKCLLIWDEEDNNCGFDYIDPSRDVCETGSFHDEFVQEHKDEDDDDYTYYSIDREALTLHALEVCEDPDFEGRV